MRRKELMDVVKEGGRRWSAHPPRKTFESQVQRRRSRRLSLRPNSNRKDLQLPTPSESSSPALFPTTTEKSLTLARESIKNLSQVHNLKGSLQASQRKSITELHL
jgi:hypothetical protein